MNKETKEWLSYVIGSIIYAGILLYILFKINPV